MPHLHDERVVLATGPEVVDLWDTLVAADLLVEEEFNVREKQKEKKNPKTSDEEELWQLLGS